MDMAFAFIYPVAGWTFYILMPLAPFIYLVLRWRAYKEQSPADPQLGLKTLLYYFRTMSYHLILVGEFCLLYGLMEESSRWIMLRMSAAMFLGGGLIYGFHVFWLVKHTNTTEFPNVARLYNGFNALMCGLVGMGALVSCLGALLAEEPVWEVFKVGAALFVVYGSAWFAQTTLLIRRSPARVSEKV